MEGGELIQMIANLGFPIAMTCYLLWYMNRMDERHDSEVAKLREIVERNTEALLSLKESITHAMKKDES